MGFSLAEAKMTTKDKQTLAAALLCLCPWFTVLCVLRLICELMR